MKRLQFRHNNTIWESREAALQYFNHIIDENRTDCIGETLYAEPLVAKYLDGDGKQQVIFAIGVDSGLTPYHIIDSKAIVESIEAEVIRAMEAEAFLSGAVDTERVERIAADNFLSGAVDTEIIRAMEAEAFLSGAVETERVERIAADAHLQTQITDNIAKIKSIEVSGANVLEEFGLYNAKNEKLGESIRIYKDSSLVGALIGFKGADRVTKNEDGTFTLGYSESERDDSVEYLYLVYKDENGDLKLVGIDFENFLLEAEFGDGLKILEHVVSIKLVDGEKYLNVTSGGLQTVNIDEAIKDAIDELSDNLTKKIDEEIARSVAADEYISGLTAEFSASTVSEIARLDTDILFLSGAVDTEIARAMEAEAFLSGAVDTERVERIAEDDAIKAEIVSNKIISKDLVVDKQVSGTSLTIQTDEVTITKYADAQGIYDSQVSILGSLLKIKQVESTDSAVKSRYELQGADGKMIGDPIVLPVESALVDVKQGKEGDAIDPLTGNYITDGTGDTTMNFVYRLEDGSYELMQVVVAEYFTDSHFGRGLNNQDGVVSILEGDGNEFLVIGEDTIAVVGVSNAIRNALDESKAYVDTKVDGKFDDKGSAAQALEESKSYTDTRIEDVTYSVDSLSETINTAIDGMNTTLNTAIDGMNTTLNNAVDGMHSTINESVSSMNDTLNTAVQGMNDTVDAAVQSMTDTLNIAVEGMNETIDAAVQGMNDTLNGAIGQVNDALLNEETNREAADEAIRETISGLTTEISAIKVNITEVISSGVALETKVDTLSGNVVSAISIAKTDIINEVTSGYIKNDVIIYESATTYTDNVVNNAVESINSKKVNDVIFDTKSKEIYLTFADDTHSKGFDASDFIVDGMLSSVTFDNTANTISFVWNTEADIKETIVPLDKFVDQYIVSEDSVSFLKISNDNKVSAIVDNGDGFSNTLASTNYVKNSVEVAQQTLSAITAANIDKLSADTIANIDKLSADTIANIDKLSADTIANIDKLSADTAANIDTVSAITTENIERIDADVVYVSGAVDTNIALVNSKIDNVSAITTDNISRIDANVVYVSGAVNTFSAATNENVNRIDRDIVALSGAVATLNGDVNVEGSVLYRVENKFEKALITDGVPVTSVTPEEANNIHSLIRQISVNGEMRYYAVSNATEMFYVKPKKADETQNEVVVLNDYITSLEQRIAILEGKLDGFAGDLEQTIKDIMKSYLVGTENEIKISETDEKLKIGFDDNAIFGEI